MNELVNHFLLMDLSNEKLINKVYTQLYISYFDHFLSEEEYSNQELVCYADIERDLDKQKLFNSIKSKFIGMYKQFYNLAAGEVITINQGKVLNNTPYNVYQKMVVNALKENPLCEFFYPSLNFISLTGYDLTHQILIPKESDDIEILFNILSETVSNVGLYLLKI